MSAAGDHPDQEPWLTPFDAGHLVGKSDQTIISWVKNGEYQPDEWRQAGDRYTVKEAPTRRIAAAKPRPRTGRSRTEPSAIGSTSPLDPGEAADLENLRRKLKDTERDLEDATNERDRLRAELHLLRQTARDLNTALDRYI
jgi:hypothetical protein